MLCRYTWQTSTDGWIRCERVPHDSGSHIHGESSVHVKLETTYPHFWIEHAEKETTLLKGE